MISNIQTCASIKTPRPSAAETDHIKEPDVTPAATARPDFLPAAIDVPAMANVAGPGLALATRAASKMIGRLMSSMGSARIAVTPTIQVGNPTHKREFYFQ